MRKGNYLSKGKNAVDVVKYAHNAECCDYMKSAALYSHLLLSCMSKSRKEQGTKCVSWGGIHVHDTNNAVKLPIHGTEKK